MGSCAATTSTTSRSACTGCRRGLATIEQFNHFLEAAGFTLNDAGGKIKTSRDGLLLQSATVAELMQAEFAGDEQHPIPGSYVEFAERRVLPEHRHVRGPAARAMRREGFEAGNADRIFESTYQAQSGQRHRPRGADNPGSALPLPSNPKDAN